MQSFTMECICSVP